MIGHSGDFAGFNALGESLRIVLDPSMKDR